MTQQETQEKLQAIGNGKYFHLVFAKEKEGYKRTTTTIVRIVRYANTKKAKERRANNPSKPQKVNESDKYLGNNLIYNENTKKTRLQVFLTNCKYHQPKSVFEYNGQEITSEEYYQGTNTKPSNPTELMNINIEEIVAIY